VSRFTLRQLLPKGPVLKAAERAATWTEPRPSTVTYTGEARHPGPVLPIMPFGVAYDLDLVLVTRHPTWDMHELARLTTPDGPVWFAKDARATTLEQSIVTDVPDLAGWMPELPVPRKRWPVAVIDESSPHRLDLDITWENLDGELTRVRYTGPPPTSPQPRRNGSTMGHSRQTLMAALDLSHRDWARRTTVSYDGREIGLHRLLFLKPFAMALQQTQGGLLTGAYTQQASTDGLLVTHERDDASWPQSWTLTSAGGFTTATQADTLRTLTHRFLESGDSLELCEISVAQFGREHAPMRALFTPALPDLRRPFDGSGLSRFVVDINGQESHAIGRATATWTGDEARVDLRPEAPWWVADRPMTIRACSDASSGVATLRIQRTK